MPRPVFLPALPLDLAHVSAIEVALRANDVAGASNRLADWQGEPVEQAEAGAVARLSAEHALRDAHHGTFAPLFWFLVLPGPLGLLLYPAGAARRARWERDFGWFAARAFHVIDWIPQRLTAFVFAVVGDFEDALFCWRSQSAQWVPARGGHRARERRGRARREARRADRFGRRLAGSPGPRRRRSRRARTP
jgi:cobalamin biosynthesis protein CobD/CbiB